MASATKSDDANEIRRQMALIRRELHEDVREVVASAEAVADWRRYIRKNPWLALGAATVVGYLIVPKRHRSVPADLARRSDVAQVRNVVEEAAEKVKASPRKGLLAGAFGLLAPVAVRAVQGFVVRHLEHWIAQLQEQQMSMAGVPPTSTGPQPPPTGPRRPAGY